ncbi:MAG TPA: MlaD family protein, partial [Verrucomicrobiae bacterium]
AYIQSSAGLNVGDPVVMMGFPAGRITRIHPMPPGDNRGVLVEFEVRAPYFRYLWTGGSYLKVNAAGLLNQRQLEVTRATNGYALVVTQPVTIFTNLDDLRQNVIADPNHWQLSQDVFDKESNLVFGAYTFLTETNLQSIAALNPGPLYAYNNLEKDNHHVAASWDGRQHHYRIFTEGDESAYLRAVETPPVSDQLQAMVGQLQSALPGILNLTNKLAAVLDNAADATSNLNATIVSARPMVTNFTVISSALREPGSPLVWVLGASGSGQVQGALTNLNSLLASTDTNLNTLTASIGTTLENVSSITSNLNVQVRANSNLLWGISKTVMDADSLVQGLKHHWLLRSAFKSKATNAPAKMEHTKIKP